jgi:hypothetical protein
MSNGAVRNFVSVRSKLRTFPIYQTCRRDIGVRALRHFEITCLALELLFTLGARKEK